MGDIILVTFPILRSRMLELREKTKTTSHGKAVAAAVDFYLAAHTE